MNYTNLKEALQRRIAFYKVRRDRAEKRKETLRRGARGWSYYKGLQDTYYVIVIELERLLEEAERS